MVLTRLYCGHNLLTSLNLSGLSALTMFDCRSNSLSCIQVNDVATATANNNWLKDAKANYSLNCSGLNSVTATNELTKGVVVYPNPTQSILNLTFVTAIDNIIIIDLTGKIVLNQKPTSGQVNVQNLDKGMYILQVYSGEDKYQTKFSKE